MSLSTDQIIAKSLRSILDDLPAEADLPESDDYRVFLVGLGCFIPEVLSEIHPEWNYESLDGVLPRVARKTGEGEAELFGLCILITDQRLAPFHIRLQVSSLKDELSWFECKLGEIGEHGMVRTPYGDSKARVRLFYALEARTMDWAYIVAFAEKRS